jgi:hypothetical protein
LNWLRLYGAAQVKPPDLFYIVSDIKDLPAYRSRASAHFG